MNPGNHPGIFFVAIIQQWWRNMSGSQLCIIQYSKYYAQS